MAPTFESFPETGLSGPETVSAADELRKHAAQLTTLTGIVVSVAEEVGRILVVLAGVPLPPNTFRLRQTDMLFIADSMYPLSAMDMFWTEVNVVRLDGSVPAAAESIEQYAGRTWRRFSWHRNSVWNPAGNPLLDHFSFAESRLAMEVRG